MHVFNKPDDLNVDHPDLIPLDGDSGYSEAPPIDELEVYTPAIMSLSAPRARRQMKQLNGDLQQAKFDLHLLSKGEKVVRTPLLVDALVSAATDLQLPLDQSPQIDAYRRRATLGHFDERAQLADDELDSAIMAVTAALGALEVASVLDEPIPPGWSNLPPLDLARKLTRLGHNLLRGRVPRMNV